jgi:uncharacterized protein YwgA
MANNFVHVHERDPKDTAQDVLLLLYLLKKAGDNISGGDNFEARIKLMKLVFLAEKEMLDKGLKGFNFFFNVYKHGPSSKEVLQMLDDVKSSGLIDFDSVNNTFLLTSKGRGVISDFVDSGNVNKDFFENIDKVISKYGELRTDKLLETVYGMKIKPLYGNREIEIGKAVKEGSKARLLMKLDRNNTKKELDVPAEWIETVSVLMNPELSDLA